MTLRLTQFLRDRTCCPIHALSLQVFSKKVLEHRIGTILHAIMCCIVFYRHKKKNYTRLDVCFYFPMKTYRKLVNLFN